MEKNKINVKNVCIIIAYFIISFLLPNTILESFIPTVLDIIKVFGIACMIIFYIYIHIVEKVKFDKIDLLFFINSAFLIFTTFINGNISAGNLYAALVMFFMPVFIKDSLKRSNKILDVLYVIYVAVIILNFITMFIKIPIDNGLRYSFIGGKNAISMTIVPAMMIISLHSLNGHKKITIFNKILLAICILSLVLSKSSTGIIIAVISLAYLLFLHKVTISFYKYALVYFTIFLLVVFGTPILKDSFIDKTVNELFGKNITFSNRTKIWNISLENSMKSPIIGYGMTNNIIREQFNVGDVKESHNLILELLLSGGIISLALFIAIIYNTCKVLKEKKQTNNVLLFYLFLYFIIGLVESITFHAQLWMMIGVIYYFGRNNNDINKTNTDKLLLEEGKET